MPSNHLILCNSLLFLSSIVPSIRVFSSESVLCITWPKYWSFSFSISLSNEYSQLISFRIDWFDLLAVQGTLQVILLGMGIPHHHCLGPRYPGRWRLCREDGWIGRTWGLEVPGAQCPQGVRLPGPSPPQRRLLSCATSWTLGGHRVPPTGDSLLLRGQPTLSTAAVGVQVRPCGAARGAVHSGAPPGYLGSPTRCQQLPVSGGDKQSCLWMRPSVSWRAEWPHVTASALESSLHRSRTLACESCLAH